MEKKDSVFAGLNPAPPSPAAAPRAAVPDQEVAELKKKMEAMEKNIASHLEKRLGETLKTAVQSEAASHPPPPPSQPDIAQFLLARIGELDKKLEGFSRSAMLSSAQMKNIEESKISARREIEDLLKAVREQQKYSEMDRQMHDQLEKSWRRVEELEKKLTDFYGSILAGQQRKEDIDGMLSRDLGGKIEALAARFEQHAQALEKRFLAQEGSLAAAADLKKEVMAELKLSREETPGFGGEQIAAIRIMFEDVLRNSVGAELERIRKASCTEAELFRKESAGHMMDMRAVFEKLVKDRFEAVQASVSAELERSRRDAAAETDLFKKELAGHITDMRPMFEKLVKDRLEAMQASVSAELERSRRGAAAEKESFKKEFAEHLAGMRNMLEEFSRAARENLAATEGAAGAIAGNTAVTAALLRENLEKISEALAREGGKFLSELEERNRRHFEALNTKYADALSNASVLDFIGAAAAACAEKMAALEQTLSVLITQADKDRLSAALGVSGMLVRKNLEAMESLLAAIRQDASALERIRKEAGERLRP